ncbi:Nudix hydrolase 2 [Operophtera brumata]|uniref:Nudix hydrolase 2 n=1 Tax=Operophtera brumata TaxID=104452 RepID=A0A0L7L0A1_OPEBR|nr:Nudix hydrolase 2 [Operophtera brumata]
MEKGFTFHHARDGFVMMYKWLPQDSEPNLPPACHTNLGVGALVFNDQKQILTEETGVDAAYLSLITFRHTHNMMFGNSDIYVLLMMKALTNDIIINEVQDCKWMDIEEYSKHPHVHKFNRLVVQKAFEYRNRNLKLDLEKRTVLVM